jgi:ATP-binding cassette subfamily B protein
MGFPGSRFGHLLSLVNTTSFYCGPASFYGESYFNDQTYSLSRSQTPERRELDYIRYIGASDETAKEVKIFDLSGFLIERFRKLSGKFYRDNKGLAIKRSFWGTLFSVIGSLGYYGAYVYII